MKKEIQFDLLRKEYNKKKLKFQVYNGSEGKSEKDDFEIFENFNFNFNNKIFFYIDVKKNLMCSNSSSSNILCKI